MSGSHLFPPVMCSRIRHELAKQKSRKSCCLAMKPCTALTSITTSRHP
jgi:hypothetical protein